MVRVVEQPGPQPPPAVVGIAKDLERAGFVAWCVGGAVRDEILGQPHLDWDFATNATPDQVRTVFGRKRTIPVGIEFGTVGVLDDNGVMHEVTTFRRDVRTDGRHAEVEFGASLEEDLARRDFTINAIAFSPITGEMRDPCGGMEDIVDGRVRAVGDPSERMREDRLRALRGIRFAARFGFEIESATWEAIKESAPHLTRLSAERVKQELEKTMDQVVEPRKAIEKWIEAGAARVLVPEIEALSDEARRALNRALPPGPPKRPGRRLVRLAVLFSDGTSGSVERAALRLRFSKHDALWLAALVGAWRELDGPMSSALDAGQVTDAHVRRWVATIGRTRLAAFFRLAAARLVSRPPFEARALRVRSLYRRCLIASLKDPVDLRDLAVDGDDLRGAGIQPGPTLGKLLAVLLDRVIEDPSLNTRERLLQIAKDWTV